jgi:hypothetical protein
MSGSPSNSRAVSHLLPVYPRSRCVQLMRPLAAQEEVSDSRRRSSGENIITECLCSGAFPRELCELHGPILTSGIC